MLLKENSDIGTVLGNIIEELEVKNKNKVKYIRCDNSIENLHITREIKILILNMKVEKTSTHTPQKNWVVERDFSYLWTYIRDTINIMYLSGYQRSILW